MPFMKGIAYSKLPREQQLEYMREKNKAAYLCKVGGTLKNNMCHTEETRKQKARDKANARCTRAKLARYFDEFTLFAFKEAQDLRRLRNASTNIHWHVDHIVPLRGKQVCGLHIWNNFTVIPKLLNLQKGNKYALHD